MKKHDYEIIISTCDRFSDLWEGNIRLLNENWPDRNARTCLVTDAPTDRAFPGVEMVCAGAGLEITDRLRKALESVRTEYVIFTLDDYFLTRRIDQAKLLRALEFMDGEEMDYIQLYPQPKSFLKRDGARESARYPGIYHVDLTSGNYKVVLTPGIWRTDFLRKTLNGSLNAWEYEVSLTPRARELGARCATSNCGEFPYLDVVRKGKLLRRAARYFRKNPICRTSRQVMGWREEANLALRTQMKFWLPRGLLRTIKKCMIRLGYSFYSPVD